MRKGVYWLLSLFLVIVVVLVIRIMTEPTCFVSPDSTFYLSAAQHLVEGKGLVAPHPVPPHEESYFAIWPAGYPLCIAFIGLLMGTSVLVASKIVNILFLGLTFWLLYRWFGEKAWFVALIFCSYGLLEIYSYSWSESSFLFFVLLLSYIVTKSFQITDSRFLFLQVACCLIALFMFRYAGLIYFIAMGFVLLYCIYKKEIQKARHYFGALILASLFVLFYFYVNHRMTGHYTGIGDRVQLEQESVPQFFLLFVKGMLNQFSLARNYFFKGTMDYLYLVLLFLQVLVLFVLFNNKKKIPAHFFRPTPILVLVAFGLFYLISIFMLRKIQPFDPFDYRILAPFSLPVYVSLLYRLTTSDAEAYYKKTQPWVTAFMLLSLVVNLPKHDVFDWIKDLL